MRFLNYIQFREESKEPSFVTSKIKLQKDNGSKDFSPFTVNKNSHSNLRPIIKAFQNSNQVGVGYTTIDKSKGEVEPQLKKKSIYLTGGAVRDHLKGKTPKNYDLVTDATMSEIRMILSQSEEDFVEVKPVSSKHAEDKKYEDLPNSTRGKKFYVSRWDKKGKEIEITSEINGEKFNIATLSKSIKSRLVEPEKAETASSIEEDSYNRDLTINSLYIPLTTPDGDNNDLVDPYGGATHLKNNQVKFVGDKVEDRLKEDPTTAFRLLRINARYGDPDKLPKEYQKAIKGHVKEISSLPKNVVRKEFLDGLEHPDSDPRKYMKLAHLTDLLSVIFPDIEFNPQEMPENFKGDRWLSTAWVLRNNSADSIKSLLVSSGWSNQEAADIAYLVRLYTWAGKDKFNSDDFYDIKSAHTGLTKSKIKEWMKMVDLDKGELEKFLSYDDHDLKPYVSNTDGKKSLNPIFKDLLGRSPVGKEFDYIKRNLSTNRWKDTIQGK
jgi:tRNA nucleotidyltransferase/poly(A) polymerase